MTNWITLTAPKEPHRHAGPIPEVDALINEARDAAPPTVFHLRADIITEIVPSAAETVIRTSTGVQYVCGETAAQVLDLIANRHNVPPDQRRPIRAYNDVMPEAG